MSNLNNFLNIGANTGNFIGNITTTANISGDNIIATSNISAGNLSVGNLSSGNLNAGNLTGNTANFSNNITTIANISGNNINSSLAFLIGDSANASSAKLRLTASGTETYIQVGNGSLGSNGNVTFSPFFSSDPRVVINTRTGDITSQGNITNTGNITTTGGNINLSGNIVRNSGPLGIITGGNANISLSPGGIGNVNVTANLIASGTIRDSLGPVRNMLNGQVIAGDLNITIPGGTAADILTFALPAAGTYLINYTGRFSVTGNAAITNWGVMFLTDGNNGIFADTRILAQYFASSATLNEIQNQVSSSHLLTVTGPVTYKFRAASESGPIKVLSDGAGRCKVVWVRVST